MDERNRRLKKYEADPLVVLSDPGNGASSPLEFHSPFGPMIARSSVGPDIVERLNRHADRRAPATDSAEFLLPPDFLTEGGERSVASETTHLIRRYLRGIGEDPMGRLEFENFWIVSQRASTASPVHFHSGDLSGVLYLRTPEVDAGEERGNYISGRNAGYINFLSGGKQRFSRSLISFKPRVGDFYVFPGWLLHGVEPFRGRGERRSMAFNAFVRTERTA